MFEKNYTCVIKPYMFDKNLFMFEKKFIWLMKAYMFEKMIKI